MEFEVKVPVLGFDNLKKVKIEKVDDLFMKLFNAEGDYPSFMLINPYALREYEFDLPAAAKVLLDIKQDSKLLILNTMILQEPIENSTINFIAPLVFNFDNLTMGQVVLDSGRYPDFGITDPISRYLNDE